MANDIAVAINATQLDLNRRAESFSLIRCSEDAPVPPSPSGRRRGRGLRGTQPATTSLGYTSACLRSRSTGDADGRPGAPTRTRGARESAILALEQLQNFADRCVPAPARWHPGHAAGPSGAGSPSTHDARADTRPGVGRGREVADVERPHTVRAPWRLRSSPVSTNSFGSDVKWLCTATTSWCRAAGRPSSPRA